MPIQIHKIFICILIITLLTSTTVNSDNGGSFTASVIHHEESSGQKESQDKDRSEIRGQGSASHYSSDTHCLSIIKSNKNDSYEVGEDVHISLTVHCSNPKGAQDLVVTDPIPDGFIIIDSKPNNSGNPSTYYKPSRLSNVIEWSYKGETKGSDTYFEYNIRTNISDCYILKSATASAKDNVPGYSDEIRISIDPKDPFEDFGYIPEHIKQGDVFNIYALLYNECGVPDCELQMNGDDKIINHNNKTSKQFNGKICCYYSWELSGYPAGEKCFILNSGKYSRNIIIPIKRPFFDKDTIVTILCAIFGMFSLGAGFGYFKSKDNPVDPSADKAITEERRCEPVNSHNNAIDRGSAAANTEAASRDIKEGLANERRENEAEAPSKGQ